MEVTMETVMISMNVLSEVPTMEAAPMPMVPSEAPKMVQVQIRKEKSTHTLCPTSRDFGILHGGGSSKWRLESRRQREGRG